jgi:primase-polymerase (primpol)-like protein
MRKVIKLKPKNIPSRLKEIDQWDCWQYELRNNSKKSTKVLYNANTHYNASTKKRSTWASFEP